MTLRGRLTTAFLAVVLGPVVLGSLFVGMTVATVTRDRTVDRLDHAATTVRTAIGAQCRQLQAVADAVAVVPAGDRTAAGRQMVSRRLASTVTTDGVMQPGWRDCDEPAGGVAALVARAHAGDTTVAAAQTLDAGFISRLAASSGADVTLLSGNGPGSWPVQSTVTGRAGREVAVVAARPADSSGSPAMAAGSSGGQAGAAGSAGNPADAAGSAGDRAGTATAALRIADAAAVRTRHGDRYVRRIDSAPGQPLPLVVSAPAAAPVGLYAILLGVVLLVGAAAVLAARRLAESTTRPLADLALAADRVAEGDLDTRVPVARNDEIGRLAGAFNRMTRELRAYVQALTASRDQLRGHLAILGDTLSSTHDLHRILQVILQTARSVTGARAGVVFLIDPIENVLVARCAEGMTDVPAMRVPLDQGVIGAVATTAEACRGRNDGDGPHGRTYVAVPICAPAIVGDPLVPDGPPPGGRPTVLGVLALYDSLGSDGFDDTDLLTLRTFAGQAGVAVHNVRMHEEAQRLSLTDPLTGLWNYRYLRESLRREVERASRFGRMLTVLVLDLDHFKEVNDSYGHAAGDTVLSEFARRIRVALREVDVAFRQGGEEFVVLLPETDAYGGAIVAERLGAAIRDLPVLINPRRQDVVHVPVTVSIGVAVYPEHGSTAQQVLEAADDALYAAKRAGRDTYRLAEVVSTAVPDGHFGPAAAAPGGPQPPRQGRGR